MLAGLLIAVIAAAALWAPAAARADGDPASDVLVGQTLFNPIDHPVAGRALSELLAEMTAAGHDGFPIRVAVIASPADLGSVSALWLRPAAYASYLGTELSFVYHGTLLVVMPDGFGVQRVGAAGGAPAPVLTGLKVPGTALGAAAIAAVARLAADAGHPLGTVAAHPAATPSAPAGSWLESVDLGSWIALLAGALAIAAAWGASLRARPARSPWRARSSTG